MIKQNDIVKLHHFLGSLKPDDTVARGENYWLLIGETGVVVSIENEKALIRFDCDVRSFGLHCHNPIANTLWISLDDIEKI
ncbi:hypothetical protein MmiAt1_07190 [Methanimicrococcus sp. At1]|uniref:Uncharacterized protein n=1 Tax=Methanimicrococcus hacksteinii TaxID=3028293 RepID=A0ABU3VP23_9EURY|nr:hypothetical protein [Methanimicrococcus sp. At1]MDV0445162.1 hypothetical protein [Methanimicrococcus sp. At1]